MSSLMRTPPVLSTPDTRIFEDPILPPIHQGHSDEDIFIIYEIQRTIAEIKCGRWVRVALQFPDEMLPDAPRVLKALQDGLSKIPAVGAISSVDEHRHAAAVEKLQLGPKDLLEVERLYILADTSYGACCVDEVAAEHVDADVVVHYGRACLSPTARLPVIHIFTKQSLDTGAVVDAFEGTFPNIRDKVILMADVTYQSHIAKVADLLRTRGYTNIHPTEILHDPSSSLPNRTVPDEVRDDSERLKSWQMFHISDPPQSLLLILSSRLSSIYIYPTYKILNRARPETILASTVLSLRRRYALLTSLNTVSIFGILINTLSVKNYLHIVEQVTAQIRAAGKKSYTFVMGKLNAAKTANFSEVGGWVVVGCWESSLIESKDFWKPVITPFELELALQGDGERIWTGEWRSDFQGLLSLSDPETARSEQHNEAHSPTFGAERDGGDVDSEPESAPPEFDLRTGRYVSHSRPMQRSHIMKQEISQSKGGVTHTSMIQSMIKRDKGELAMIGGETSPGAQFLQSRRTWKGLGSDFEITYEESRVESSTGIEEGRSGIARGYTDDVQRAKR